MFGPGTRRALTHWQKARERPDSGFLTRAQQAALWEESEPGYRRLLAARPPAERTVKAARPPRPAPAAAAPTREAVAAPPQPAPRPAGGGGASLGEMGQFLGGVGNLVGSMRR